MGEFSAAEQSWLEVQNKEMPRLQGSTWAVAERLVGSKSDPSWWATVKLVEILDRDYQVKDLGDGRGDVRMATLSDADIERAKEYISHSSVTPRHIATLLLAREFDALADDPSMSFELEYQTNLVKARLLDNFARSIPFEYNQYARHFQGDDVDEKARWGDAAGAIGDYFRSRISSGDELYALSSEGKIQLASALKNILAHYQHSDWDHILSKAVTLLESAGGKDSKEFEELLSEAHGNNLLLGALVTGDQTDVDTSLALLAIHNSGTYGIRKTWNYLPVHIQELMKTDQLALFELGTKYGRYDITLVVSSIMKAHNFESMYELGKAVYNFETDQQDKKRLHKALLKDGLDVTLRRDQARALYEKLSGDK